MTPEFHFPSDIKLESNPLLEAWLEIRWQLEPLREDGPPQLAKDPHFAFALGMFYEGVKNPYAYREDLASSQAPDGFLPHIVRHQFRPGENEWPILQLGPGVATVNFAGAYTWSTFSETALYLRSKLLQAYAEAELESEMVALRYRNGVPFESGSNDLLRFIQQNLNTGIELPSHIPGPVGSKAWPTSANVVFTFDLSEPKGTGTLGLMTGELRRTDPDTGQGRSDKMLMWQLDVVSGGDDAPAIGEEEPFGHWLTSAHAVVHEWFFSLIDGPLRETYETELE